MRLCKFIPALFENQLVLKKGVLPAPKWLEIYKIKASGLSYEDFVGCFAHGYNSWKYFAAAVYRPLIISGRGQDSLK